MHLRGADDGRQCCALEQFREFLLPTWRQFKDLVQDQLELGRAFFDGLAQQAQLDGAAHLIGGLKIRNLGSTFSATISKTWRSSFCTEVTGSLAYGYDFSDFHLSTRLRAASTSRLLKCARIVSFARCIRS